ncbi:MAG: iron-sulfur cluster carrier protein ApbC [Pseudomonadota bacterium]
MSDLSKSTIDTFLDQFADDFIDLRLDEAGAEISAELEESHLKVRLGVGFPVARHRYRLSAALEAALREAFEALDKVTIEVQSSVRSHAVQANLKPIDGIANVIAVASAKGGVGKSTTAANMALALASEGARTGLLDADIYGPSQPRMLGLRGRQPTSPDGKHVDPLKAHGIVAMSIGFMVDEATPMVWRGPMVTQALNQLIAQTNWGELDYLIVDMPPGTGDTQLTLGQRVPLSGVVIVTTPQDIALLDARKGLKMFEKINVNVLGVVENMSTHICSKCGHEEHIFGNDGGRRMAEEDGVPFLGALPLDIRIREQADGGVPTVIAEPDGGLADDYRRIALRATSRLAAQKRDYSHRFPNIVVE